MRSLRGFYHEPFDLVRNIVGAIRHSRSARRREAVSIRLQDRDRWLLEGLAKMRFLTTGQLARLYFKGSRWAANKRLRKLLDAGLVRVWVRGLAQENIYSLDRAGTKVLDGMSEDFGPLAIPRGLDGNLDHLLGINQIRVTLAVRLPEAGGEISWWRSDWELRSHGPEKVIPDALFAIRWPGEEEEVYALEVDNQSRCSGAFLKKILKYGSVRYQARGLYGVSDFVTLVVGRDPEWVERYRQSLGHTRLGSRIWFTELAEVEAKGALGPIWKPADREESYSLRDLIFRPYGKEGIVPKTPTFRDG